VQPINECGTGLSTLGLEHADDALHLIANAYTLEPLPTRAFG
jgi:hypothetical protein